ncbi:MAG: sigma-70 family RNA polymerase sigma factor [Haliscomenobacter sp.]|nr:hypothetical protein [Haliscomenobacter sp.]MBK9492828.1 sigma-70 family RNA polymerase sigma factor [Haliscomenobacter sp.]
MRDESITITSKVEAYIFGIAKLKLREFYRIKEKQKKAMEALGLLNEEETKETEQDVDLDLVIRYLENLNPICQDLIKLKFWGDKTHAEISTSIPELLNDNNSRQRLRYCLGQLRQFFLENIKN